MSNETTTDADLDHLYEMFGSDLIGVLTGGGLHAAQGRERSGWSDETSTAQQLATSIVSYPPGQDPPEEYRHKLEALASQPPGSKGRWVAGMMCLALDRHEHEIRADIAAELAASAASARGEG
jgi:ADP-ribosylglycohydrolase